MTKTLFTLMMLAAVPLAFAGGPAQFMAANPLAEGEVPDVVWNMTADDLDRHPIVTKVLADLHNLVPLEDEEVVAAEAFLAQLNELGTNAIRVDGQAYMIGLAFASAPVDDGMVTVQDQPTAKSGHGIAVILAAAGAALVVGTLLGLALGRRS